MPFKVMAERCDQCLYGPNKIVSDERRKEILRETVGRDRYFVCHRATIYDTEACCRGDWDAHGGGQLGRMAERLGAVVFVTEAELVVPKPEGGVR